MPDKNDIMFFDFSKERDNLNKTLKRLDKNEVELSNFKTYGQLLEVLKNDDEFIERLKYEIIKELYLNKTLDKNRTNESVQDKLNKEELLNSFLFIRDINEDFDNHVLICNVKSILEKEGKTQKWLSQKSKIPQSSLSGILKNTSTTSLEYAFRISLAMQKPIEELFEYIDLNDFNSDTK